MTRRCSGLSDTTFYFSLLHQASDLSSLALHNVYSHALGVREKCVSAVSVVNKPYRGQADFPALAAHFPGRGRRWWLDEIRLFNGAGPADEPQRMRRPTPPPESSDRRQETGLSQAGWASSSAAPLT